jgi:hypothetical protein
MPESARDALAYAAGALTPARKVGELLDGYRADVLSEAADKLKASGHADAAECLRRWADEPATPAP